jgi:hypothetical protein
MQGHQLNMLLFGVGLLSIAFIVLPILGILGINLTSFFVTNQFNGSGVLTAILGGVGAVFIVVPFFMSKRGS